MNLTDADVDEILRLLEKSPYNELKLTTDRFTLELRSGTSEKPKSNESGSDAVRSAAAMAEPAAPTKATPTKAAAAGEIIEIFPPMTGTFYRAPSPGAHPFTEVGKIVEPDTTLGLVETMKLMNSVAAGCHGEVTEICVENGALVEAEDVLVRIRVTGSG